MNKVSYILLFLTIFGSQVLDFNNKRIQADDLCKLEGYILVQCTELTETIDGDDGEVFKLENDWVFEIIDRKGYGSFYAYNKVAIFEYNLDRKYGVSGVSSSYILVIDEEIFEVDRLK